MAPNKSPAFQFYARDFLTGVATMSLAERGAYISLLAHQWDAGIVPNSSDERARILGCTKAQEKTIWQQIGKKFAPVDGGYQNSRLEEERAKQAEYRRRQSDAGKASAMSRTMTTVVKSRLEPEGNHGSTTVASRLEPEGNSSSAFASSVKDQEQQQRAAPLIKSPAYVAKRLEFCAFVGSRIEVPRGLHAELRDSVGGPNPEKELQDWYLELDERAEMDAWRIPKDKDFYPWFKALYGQKFPAPAIVNGKPKRTEAEQLARLQAIEQGAKISDVR